MGHRPPPPRQTTTPEQTERIQQQKRSRLRELQALDCLRNVPSDELEHLVNLCSFRAFVAGDTIINEHRSSEFFYLVFQGSVCLRMHDRENKEVLLGVLSRGDCCGEESLFSDLFRHVGAYADTHCYMLQLPLAELRSLLDKSPHLHEELRRIHMRRLVEGTLAHGTLFNQILPMERLSLAALLEPVHYPRDTIIMRCGDEGTAFYIIETGQAVVEQGDRPLAILDEGDFFGEIALFCQQQHSATVRTITPADVLMLPANRFHDLILQQPGLELKLQHIVSQRRIADEHHLQSGAYPVRLQGIIEKGLRRGTHLLVRTPALCPPNCRLCEQACAARFGQTRLHLHGVSYNQYDIVDACRQCRVGAECMEVCPEGAFEWSTGGALCITDKCTGCGDCLSACPYPNMIARKSWSISKNQSNPLQKLIQRIPPRLSRHPVSSTGSRFYSHRADKCDLCHTYPNLACVDSCPVHALQLLPVDDVLKR